MRATRIAKGANPLGVTLHQCGRDRTDWTSKLARQVGPTRGIHVATGWKQRFSNGWSEARAEPFRADPAEQDRLSRLIPSIIQ